MSYHHLGRLLGILLWPLYSLRLMLEAGLNMIGQWFISRPWHLAGTALPCLVVAMAIGMTVGSGWRVSKSDICHRNAVAAQEATAQGDLKTAEFCFRKQLQLNPDHPEPRFSLGLIAAKRGDMVRAQELISPLAPVDAEGYGPAHLWVADRMLQDSGAERTAMQSNEVIHHLRVSVGQAPRNTQACFLLAEVLFRTGRMDEAIPYFETASGEAPAARLVLADWFLKQGQSERAIRECRLAAESYRAIVEQTPQNVQARLGWSRAEYLTGNLGEALAILRSGMPHGADNKAAEISNKLLQQAAVRILITAARLHARTGPENFASAAESMELAIALAPDEPAVMQEIADLFQSDDQLADSLRPLLENALTVGRAPSLVHAVLGSEANRHGDVEKARIHLEHAVNLNPQMADAINNLAWTWANGAEPDFEKALQFSNTAVLMKPQHPEYRETRGQILARMNRWQEALSDLEFAVRSLNNRRELHETLATVYDSLDMKSLAKKHTELAQQVDPTTGNPQ